jgi:signal peptidase
MRQGLRASGWLLVAGALVLLAMFWPQTLGGHVAYVKVDGHSMDPTFHTGDLAVVRKQSSYQLGDAVAYKIPKGEFGAGALVIHRLVAGNGTTGFITKGDNRNIRDEWHPRTSDVVGRVIYDLPGVGTKFATFTQPMYLGALVAGLTVLVMLWPSGPAAPTPPAVPTQRTTPTALTGLVRPARRGRHAQVTPSGPIR